MEGTGLSFARLVRFACAPVSPLVKRDRVNGGRGSPGPGFSVGFRRHDHPKFLQGH